MIRQTVISKLSCSWKPNNEKKYEMMDEITILPNKRLQLQANTGLYVIEKKAIN